MFVTDISRWEEFGRAHRERFGEHPPATTMVEVFMTPEDSATLFGDAVTVEISPANFDFTEGRHWHVWVDGELRGMVYDPATRLELAPFWGIRSTATSACPT